MAESVDALVSNTSGATRAGSTPALGTGVKDKWLIVNDLSFYSFKNVPILFPRNIYGDEINRNNIWLNGNKRAII